MNEMITIPSKDFGNFQLNYNITPSSDFDDLKFIDENYVATLRFTTPGVSVSVVVTSMQLEIWSSCFELSFDRGGAYMNTLPIMCAIKEDAHLNVRTYDSKLWFRSGAMVISINLADCLKDLANYINEIRLELDEKEGAW